MACQVASLLRPIFVWEPRPKRLQQASPFRHIMRVDEEKKHKREEASVGGTSGFHLPSLRLLLCPFFVVDRTL